MAPRNSRKERRAFAAINRSTRTYVVAVIQSKDIQPITSRCRWDASAITTMVKTQNHLYASKFPNRRLRSRTKYNDGDPHDGWAVGFVSEFAYEEGAKIVDNNGQIIGRFNGFRRVKKINQKRGDW